MIAGEEEDGGREIEDKKKAAKIQGIRHTHWRAIRGEVAKFCVHVPLRFEQRKHIRKWYCSTKIFIIKSPFPNRRKDNAKEVHKTLKDSKKIVVELPL